MYLFHYEGNVLVEPLKVAHAAPQFEYHWTRQSKKFHFKMVQLTALHPKTMNDIVPVKKLCEIQM
jgi:hypothetical protein